MSKNDRYRKLHYIKQYIKSQSQPRPHPPISNAGGPSHKRGRTPLAVPFGAWRLSPSELFRAEDMRRLYQEVYGVPCLEMVPLDASRLPTPLPRNASELSQRVPALYRGDVALAMLQQWQQREPPEGVGWRDALSLFMSLPREVQQPRHVACLMGACPDPSVSLNIYHAALHHCGVRASPNAILRATSAQVPRPDWDTSLRVFTSMVETPTDETYALVLRSLRDRPKRMAHRLLDDMEANHPNYRRSSRIWASYFTNFCDWAHACQLYSENLPEYGCVPKTEVYDAMLLLCLSASKHEIAREVLSLLHMRGVPMSKVTWRCTLQCSK